VIQPLYLLALDHQTFLISG